MAFLLEPRAPAPIEADRCWRRPRIVVLLYYSFSVAARNNPQFNSVTRSASGQIAAAIHVWHLSPILGEGMRFYNLPQFISVTAPPNVLIDNLASTGIIGSLAFVFMVCVTVRTMFRLPYALGTLGLVILVVHYVDGLFDIFWIGASTDRTLHHRRDLPGHGRHGQGRHAPKRRPTGQPAADPAATDRSPGRPGAPPAATAAACAAGVAVEAVRLGAIPSGSGAPPAAGPWLASGPLTRTGRR